MDLQNCSADTFHWNKKATAYYPYYSNWWARTSIFIHLPPCFHCSTGCIKIFWEIDIIAAKLIGPQILSSVCWAGPRSFEGSRWEPQHSLLWFPATRWRLSTGLWSATKRCRALQDLLITNADLIEIRSAEEAAHVCEWAKKIYSLEQKKRIFLRMFNWRYEEMKICIYIYGFKHL